MNKKSILEQALLQVETLEEAVRKNAKGILASTMKQELTDLLKEQEEEDEKLDTPDDEEDVTGLNPEDTDDETDDESEMGEKPGDKVDDVEPDNDADDEEVPEFGNESDEDEDDLDAEDELDTDDEEDADDTLDMTGASDGEVLKVFKAMKPEDGIVVKKEGENFQFSDGENDYLIKMNEQMEEEEYWKDKEEETFPDEEESIYEIELDEDDAEEEEECETKEEEFKEAARTIANGVRPPAQKMKFKAGRHEMNEEVKLLKKQNEEYKKALTLFKEKLNEVATFNANLAYATRLFTEHTTTKQEKLNILKRFDSISTIKESKNLYTTIKSELDTKKPISETVADKISSEPKTSSSTELLSEATAYESPQFKRMKELMGIKK